MSLLTNLRAYWKLDESSGNASDSSGNGHTLTNTSVSYTTSKINNGGSFDGSSSVFRNSSLSYNGESSISYSVWVKYNSLPTSGNFISIVSKYSVTGSGGYDLRLYNDGGTMKLQVQFAYSGGSNNLLTYTTTPTTGVWYHYVATRNNSTSVLYINGTSVATLAQTSKTFGNIENDLTVGALRLSGVTDRYTNGYIDEVGIWNKALTSTEVTELYNSGSGNQYPFQQDIIMSGGTGDFILTGNNASLVKNSVQLVMTADTAQFNLTGYDAGSRFAYNIIPDTLEFNLTWEDIRVLAPTTFTVDTGNFIFTGNDAQLEYRIHNYLLTADRAEFFLTGNNAQFTGQKWQNITKTTQATFSNNSKSVPTYANISKNTETFTNIDKS